LLDSLLQENMRKISILLIICNYALGDVNEDLIERFPGHEAELRSVVDQLERSGLLAAWQAAVFNPNPALLVIDMQNDFITGSLPVPKAEEILKPVQVIIDADIWGHVVFSQDWHPQNHISFFSNLESRPLDPDWLSQNPGNISIFDKVVFSGSPPYPQVLWPDHCVQGSTGAEFHDEMRIPTSHTLIRKGTNPERDSYSAFFDNSGNGDTGLADILKPDTTEVVVIGLATDYCVGSTVLDSQRIGLPATLLTDASRGVAESSTSSMLERVEESGGRVSTWEEWQGSSWERAKHLARTMMAQKSASDKVSLAPLVLAVLLYQLLE